MEPVIEEQETESTTVSLQSTSDEHLLTEVLDAPRRHPSRAHHPPTRYNNYICW